MFLLDEKWINRWKVYRNFWLSYKGIEKSLSQPQMVLSLSLSLSLSLTLSLSQFLKSHYFRGHKQITSSARVCGGSLYFPCRVHIVKSCMLQNKSEEHVIGISFPTLSLPLLIWHIPYFFFYIGAFPSTFITYISWLGSYTSVLKIAKYFRESSYVRRKDDASLSLIFSMSSLSSQINTKWRLQLALYG